MNKHFPAAGRRTPRVNRDDDALHAELLGALGDQFRTLDRRGVHGDFVGSGAQRRAHVFHGPHPAPYREGNKDGIGDRAHHGQGRRTPLVRGRDIEEDELVRPFAVVDHRLFYRIARITQVDEADALDDPALFNVEAGDDSFG